MNGAGSAATRLRAATRTSTRPLLRRLHYRTFEGELVEIWALTEVGYAVASKALGVPQKVPAVDVGAAFLEHSILLNDVLVSAVDPASQPCRRCGGTLKWRTKRGGRRDDFALQCAGRNGVGCHGTMQATLPLAGDLPFRWIGPESARLPWRDWDVKKGAKWDRIIVPDAVIEIPGRKRRLFVEFETGSHTLLASSDRKPGATSAKIERYAEFLDGFADFQQRATFYDQRYPDRWRWTVVFVVVSEVRRSSIKKLVDEHFRLQPAKLDMRAMLPEELAQYVRGTLGMAAPKPAQEQARQELPGRISVQPNYAIAVASCLQRLVGKREPIGEVSASTRKLYDELLQLSLTYAQRAAAAKAGP